MRALLIAVLLAVVTALPALADDGGADLRTSAPTLDIGAPQTWTP